MKGKTKRHPVLLVLWALILLHATACARNEAACVVRVGAVVSLTGEFGEQGQEQLRGYQMAVDQISAGGNRNARIELVWRDDQSDPHRAAVAAKDLIEQCGVSILLGATTSTTAIPVAGVAEVYQVPLLIPSATSDLITSQGYNWVFRLPAPSQEFASQAIDFIQDNENTDLVPHVATMAIVYEDSDFGNATAVAAAAQAAERGIRVVAYEVFERGREDRTREMVDRIREKDPHALFFAINYPDDAATLLRLCRCGGLNPMLYIGGEGGFAEPLFLEYAGSLAEGVLVITQWENGVPWEGACHLSAAYRAAYGADPSMLAAEAYAAIDVAYAAIEQAVYAAGGAAADKESGPTPTGEACSPARSAQTCAPVPLSEACSAPTSTPGTSAPAVTPLPTPTCPARRERARGCPESRTIRDELHKIGTGAAFETVFGPIQFDGAGQNQHIILITRVRCGGYEIVGPPGYGTGN